jgi:hypothetical protein
MLFPFFSGVYYKELKKKTAGGKSDANSVGHLGIVRLARDILLSTVNTWIIEMIEIVKFEDGSPVPKLLFSEFLAGWHTYIMKLIDLLFYR